MFLAQLNGLKVGFVPFMAYLTAMALFRVFLDLPFYIVKQVQHECVLFVFFSLCKYGPTGGYTILECCNKIVLWVLKRIPIAGLCRRIVFFFKCRCCRKALVAVVFCAHYWIPVYELWPGVFGGSLIKPIAERYI